MSSMVMLPLCLMFFTFFLSLGGSFRALMMRAAAEGNRDGGLSVLNLQLDGNLQALPLSGVLGNVVTNLLGRQTQRTDLGGQRGGGSDLASNGSEVDVFHLIGIKLGRHLGLDE